MDTGSPYVTWDALSGVGAGLILFGFLAAAVNVRRCRAGHLPHWFLGSVWSPLLPVTVGTVALTYDLMRLLAAALP
jgi:hypothetical protein